MEKKPGSRRAPLALVENNRWKRECPPEKENRSPQTWGTRPRRSEGTSIKSPQRVQTLELVGGLESIEQAKDLQDACMKNGSMLQSVLDKIGFHGSVEDESSNIQSARSYKVVMSMSSIAANGECRMYSIALESTRELSKTQEKRLLHVFAKHEASGFLEWLAGAKGWRFDCTKSKSKTGPAWKRRYVLQLNTLQSCFTLFASDEQKYFFVDEKKRMVWRKHEELTEIVSDIRVWIETIKPSELTSRLLRNSNSGPDSPVHWAHHHPVSIRVVSEVLRASSRLLTLPPRSF